jgi:hypothetical protein
MSPKHLVLDTLHAYGWRLLAQGATYVTAASPGIWPVRRVLVLFDELGQITEAVAWVTRLRMRETKLRTPLSSGVLLFIAGRNQ